MDVNKQSIVSRGQDRRASFTPPAWVCWLAVGIWMGLIYYLSSQSSFAIFDLAWQRDVLGVAAHFMEYAVLAALLWLALRSVSSLARFALPGAFVLAVLFAISDEWHQSFVPGRYPDVWDVLVDALGAAVALWLVRRGSLAHLMQRW
jgi:VanZ family protein